MKNVIPQQQKILISCSLLFCCLLRLPVYGQAQKDYNNVLQRWYLLRSDDNGLYRHVVKQANEHLAKRTFAVAKLKSLADWKSRQQWIRRTLLDAIGPFPERTPLNAQVVRTVQKDTYRVDHVLFESQPGFYVTASLFIPNTLKGKGPAVVYCSGHSASGYKSGGYQQILLNLVKKGFVVLAFDPVGQGERLEYLDPKTGKSIVGSQPTREHFMAGMQTYLTGTPFARYMMWDGIRAVDYLLTRPEVDPARIGMTGRSGGGTQTAFIGALDDRILATAPECYVTNFSRMLEANGPPDPEQTLPNIIGRGFDEPDFLIVRAPKPTLMITTLNDFFNIQGARDTEKEVSRIYTAYGKSENFGRVEDLAPHASTRKNREAMYAFFQKALNNPGNPKEDSVQYLTPDEINVTNTGQLLTSVKGETVFGLNKRYANDLNDRLNLSRKNLKTHLPNVIQQAKKLSGYQAPSGVDAPVLAGVMEQKGVRIEKYFIKGEGDYVVPYLLFIPPKPVQKAVLYLAPKGKASVATNAEVSTLLSDGYHVLIPDLIGTGETGPGQWMGGSYFSNVKMEGLSLEMWYGPLFIGRSIVGIRAGDVVKLVNVLKQAGTAEVSAIARQTMAPVLLHAAAFEPAIARIALIDPYSSYHALTTSQLYQPDFMEGAVPMALTAYDLPDLMATLAPRKLLIVNATDGTGNRGAQQTIRNEMAVVESAYQKKENSNQLMLFEGELANSRLTALLTDWLN